MYGASRFRLANEFFVIHKELNMAGRTRIFKNILWKFNHALWDAFLNLPTLIYFANNGNNKNESENIWNNKAGNSTSMKYKLTIKKSVPSLQILLDQLLYFVKLKKHVDFLPLFDQRH